MAQFRAAAITAVQYRLVKIKGTQSFHSVLFDVTCDLCELWRIKAGKSKKVCFLNNLFVNFKSKVKLHFQEQNLFFSVSIVKK